jgi:hypothetical protein
MRLNVKLYINCLTCFASNTPLFAKLYRVDGTEIKCMEHCTLHIAHCTLLYKVCVNHFLF